MNLKKKPNVYGNLGGMLADGFAAELQSDEADILVNLSDIEIEVQIRGEDEMEDDEQTLSDLGRSLRKRQAQAIVIRANRPGREKPYLLVAGERRVRGGRLVGLEQLRARLMTLTDEQAADLQAAENIHRLNLTQIAEAKKIQHDLDQLGSVAAVLEKYNKNPSWLSKKLSLLHLPEQAKRLVTENVSADIEVINTVKTIEKADPVKAKALVDDLKKTRGKASARDKVAAVKADVKPSKRQQEAKKGPEKQKSFDVKDMKQGGTVATPKDRSRENPSAGEIFAGAKIGGSEENGDIAKVLDNAYSKIFEFGSSASMLLELMAPEQEEEVSAWLAKYYEAGKQSKDTGRAVMQGFRNGQFATDGHLAFALVAFLQGADTGAKFSVTNILGSAKE